MMHTSVRSFTVAATAIFMSSSFIQAAPIDNVFSSTGVLSDGTSDAMPQPDLPSAPVLNIATSDNEQFGSACNVNTPYEYASNFGNGPNSCSDSRGILLTRLYMNVSLPNPLPEATDIPGLFHNSNKPFVFASGDGGCVNEWLQAGQGNTTSQFSTVLDIGYSPMERCTDIKTAQNATLVVWEPLPEDQPIWATWDNVVPYMAQLYGVDMSEVVVSPELLHSTPYLQFKSDPQYAVQYQLAQGSDWCTSTRALGSQFIKDALTTDVSGVKFRAVLEACFSFFDVFQGNGYTADLAHPDAVATKCKEYLYPNRKFNTMPITSIMAVPLQIGAQYQDQEVC